MFSLTNILAPTNKQCFIWNKNYNLHTSNSNLPNPIDKHVLHIYNFVLLHMPYICFLGRLLQRVNKPGDGWDDPAGPPSMTGRPASQKGQHHSIHSHHASLLHHLNQTEWPSAEQATAQTKQNLCFREAITAMTNKRWGKGYDEIPSSVVLVSLLTKGQKLIKCTKNLAK